MGDELSAMQRKFDSRFAALARVNAGEREQQQANIERVGSAIGRSILAFFRDHAGQTFFASELQEYVAAQCGKVAPASADRIMRQLKVRGEINYDCVNRARSLYCVLPVQPHQPGGN